MRKIAYIIIAFACGMIITSCNNREKTEENTSETAFATHTDQHADNHQDTLLIITMPDSALWGHLGEGTGMSVLQFITDSGDTLYLNKESEYTGHLGTIYGSIRNYTDRFCITTTDNGETLLKAINVTEMQELWAKDIHTENNK